MKLVGTSELLQLQTRVIVSLVLRETRATFGTSPFGYVWAIMTPTASIGLLVFIFSIAGRQPPFGSSLALFFATGILTLHFFNELSNKLMTVFDANRALLTYPIIKDVDTLFARALLVAATYTLIMAIFYATLIALGLASVPFRPEQVILAFHATWLLGLGFGTLNAVISSLWDTWTHIEKILTRPLFFISGIFYVPSQLPPQAREVLQWNPVLHLVEWFRYGFYSNYNSMILDVCYPVGVGTAMLLLGLAGERFFRRARY
ncbi:ABC transporter permease [Ruegeria profundi]|uniref:ABC transporter permease n=1 Tax=Ruegeria profundi TaxID=1685378 RepID=UPI001CD3B9CE|nr:ABC transporter permease [Ruegeria profundi]MCA0930420.1 ABC transporter permease [Ruegeria profundi]